MKTKKINIVFLSMIALVLGSLLSACTFKKVEASFSQSEIVVSLNDEIKLNDYLDVQNAEKSEIEYKFSNSTLFAVSGDTLTAKTAGKSYVYATYQNNNLASMKIVVREKFASPTNFTLSDDGVLSWSVVSAYYENDKTPTTPAQYKVEGVCEVLSASDGTTVSETKQISEIVTSNSIQLSTIGRYELTVTALANGYFDTSEKSAIQTIYFGYMPELAESDLTWGSSTGVLSWNAVSNAQYRVAFDGVLIDTLQVSTSKDLSTYFSATTSGNHTLAVVVYDTNGQKLPKQSKLLNVVKLETPTVEYSYSLTTGGKIEIATQENVENFEFVLTNVSTDEKKTITFANGDSNIVTTFENAGLGNGVYSVSVVAKQSQGNFYESSSLDFGKIYKLPTLSLTAMGENEVDGNTFNIKAGCATNGLVESSFFVSGLGELNVVDGIAIGSTEKQFTVTLSQSGKYTLSAVNAPKNETNTIGENDVFVLNSNESETIDVFKLAQFSTDGITHSYRNDVSVLTFDAVANAQKYELYYANGEDYEMVASNLYEISTIEEQIEIVLTGKIEKLFSATGNGFAFKVIAKTTDETLSIASSVTKNLTLLSAPISAGSGNSTDKTYTWGEVDNADAYKIEIYTIDKETYTNNTDSINIDVTGLEKVEETTNSASYTFENVGYYYTKIYAVSNNANEFISSLDCLEEVFYIAEKLQKATVQFGYDETYKAYNDFTESSGYFLKVGNVDNVDLFEVSVDGNTSATYKVNSSADNIYLLTNNFENNQIVTISVVGHATDETLYVSSDEEILNVQRLKTVSYADIAIDDLTTTLSVSGQTGTTGIEIWQSDHNRVSSDRTSAEFDISKLSNFDLRFSLFGTAMQDNIYQNNGGYIYLDSIPSTMSFTRLSTPIDLKYYDGNLTFTHTDVPPATSYYVLDLLCTTANAEELKIQIKFENTTTANYNNTEISLGSSANFLTINSDKVSINLDAIIALLKMSDDLADVYNQVTNIKFAVYGYQNSNNNSNVRLSSFYATAFDDVTKTSVEVKKMERPEVSFSYTTTDYVLSWTAVENTTAVADETRYVVYLNDEVQGSETNALTKTFTSGQFKGQKYYTFYVKATNPYYLESNQSNTIKIYKLQSLTSLKLTDAGKLNFEVSSYEKDFVKFVEIKTATKTYENTTSELDIVEDGSYTFKVVGNKVENAGETIYYIDSSEAVWTLAKLETIKPDDTTITFTNNVLSWNVFGQEKNFDTLSYLLIFKDENGKTVTYTTNDISVDLSETSELYQTISDLSGGTIQIQVSACLGAYSVPVGGTIYYSLNNVLLNDKTEANYYIYGTNSDIKKLTTPEVKNVEFVSTDLSDAQFPEIKVSFVGNYGNSGNFEIYVNDSDSAIARTTLVENDSAYTFSLTKENYNNTIEPGQTLKIKIKASSSTDIPSSMGEVEIVRVTDLSKVEMICEDNRYNQTLKVTFDNEHLSYVVGGVVVKIDYQETNAESKSEYVLVNVAQEQETVSYDVSEFVSNNLSKGGTIKFTAFINNFSDSSSKVYYLASPNAFETEEYNVLCAVEETQRYSGGFYITDTNDGKATYVVEYGASRFEVEKDAEEKYYFEFPNAWENATYDLTIYAIADGYVQSASYTESFALNRIGTISEVSMKRDVDDLSKVLLSWNEISGATGYIINTYAKADTEKETLLYSFDTASTTLNVENGKVTYSLTEIFGDGYSDLTDFGRITAFDLQSDIDVVFDLIVVGGSGHNNSQAYSFNATLKGNPISVSTDITYDDYGKIQFTSVDGTTYLYRFVDNSGAELQTWKKIVATSSSTKLEATDLVTNGSLFNLELVAVGSAIDDTASSADFEFILDSIKVTTLGSNTSFRLNDDIVEIGYDSSLGSNVAITMIQYSCDTLYVGTTQDAISTEKVIQIVPNEEFAGNVEGQTVYSYDLVTLVTDLKDAGYTISATNDIDLYFWSYRETTDQESIYLISKPYKFTFKFVTEEQFDTIKKVGDLGENAKFDEDFANTFAIFNNVDTSSLETVGIYVKITPLATSEDSGEASTNVTITKFVTAEEMSNNQYFDETQKVYVLNLTTLFEDEDLKGLTGKLKIEFARLQVAQSDGTYSFVLSDWLTTDGSKEFVFDRLATAKNLNLLNGNLYWTVGDEKVEKYYVYFIQEDGTYTYFSTANTYFNASEYVSTESRYYVAVQGVSEDDYVLSSLKVYVIDSENEENALIYKNQVTSPITLKNGKLVIDWSASGDFYTMLTSDGNYSDLAAELTETIFTSPITFTLSDLVNDRVKVRMSFTSINSSTQGVRKVFDINAKYLLADLYEFGMENDFNIKERLQNLTKNATSSVVGNTIDKFMTLVENGSHGIANTNTLFDDLFEAVQLGAYKLEYCLLGSSTTLNSAWYSFSNSNTENCIYVNAEPEVTASKVENDNDKSMNDYTIRIKKSQIYNYSASAYSTEVAENYVMKIYDDANNAYVFAITKGASNYSLSLQGVDNSNTVTVYETDSTGNVTAGGEYLMFYINHNDGDSILGVFNNEIKHGTYKLQIYAVGNDYSLSSKSDTFTLVLLTFGDTFSVSNGEFVWGGLNGRKTSIVYKKNTSSVEEVEQIEGTMVSSKFSLNNLGYGLYDYVKFVNIGEIKNNSIYVDSEILEIDNVYKLASPTLNNELGYIGIDDSTNIALLGDQYLQNCYSDGSLYNYILYNKDSASKITFSDENYASKILYYEAGTTGIEISNADYAYKNTEESATTFHVISVGTTASVNIEQDEDNYYLRRVYCKDAVTGDSKTTQSIAIRSEASTIDATMLDAVKNPKIENGLLKWTAVEGKTVSDGDGYTLAENEDDKIVYKITVVQYRESYDSDGKIVDTNVGEEYYYYTAKEEFDFAYIDEDKIVKTDSVTYLKATIQALALTVSEILPNQTFVELVEGGYAYGRLQYSDNTTYVLMGNGAILKEIDRLKTIDDDSLVVEDGSLYWTYTVDSDIADQDTFFANYSFVVTDSNNNEITGEFVIENIYADETNDRNIFKIKFIEDAGQMKAGTQTIQVSATQGSENDGVVIKSFARTKEITKLKTVTTDDFAIESDANIEILDLSTFFADGNTNTVDVSISVTSETETTTDFVTTMTKELCKLFILNSADEANGLTYPDGYIRNYVVIGDGETAKMTFKAKDAANNVLYGDLSKEFVLQRSSWGDAGKITWDSQNEIFTWQYDGYYTLKQDTVATEVENAYILTKDTVLYNDAALEDASSITLTAGEKIVVEEVNAGCTKIRYGLDVYYIDTANYKYATVDIGTENLSADTACKLVSSSNGIAIIETQDGKMYSVDESIVNKPVYIVEAIYGEDANQITRIYTTTDTSFKPTIISSKICLKIRIKLGSTNIQSAELEYVDDNGQNYVSFDLFESGEGTKETPYMISTAEEFLNIAKRMDKDAALKTFSQNGAEYTEDGVYYFKLQNDIDLTNVATVQASEVDAKSANSQISGFVFAGDFDGVLEGNNYTITYSSKGVSALSGDGITISDGNVLSPNTSASSFTYRYGTSLFENLLSNSSISNLNIKVSYGNTDGSSTNNVTYNSLVAGLAISNAGKLDNVNLVGFENNFIGKGSGKDQLIMVYSGLVSINTTGASITNCGVKTNMSVNDGGTAQFIFVSGIAFTNYGTIETCEVGINNTTKYKIEIVSQATTNTIQVAGVAVTNTSGATIKECTNYSHIRIENVASTNYNVVYVAGIVDLGKGTIQDDYNNADTNSEGEKFTLINVNSDSNSLHKGDISAK